MRIALVAGEPSGDFLGGGLIQALSARFPGATFEGIGGSHMTAAGLETFHPLDALSVMGVAEVLRHLPRLLVIRRDLRRRWISDPPDVFIGVDAPDFNLGLARSLRSIGIPTLQYVSPTVWAWRSGRIRLIRQAVDRMLCIYPFEDDFFARSGVDSRFVGHPLADEIALQTDHAAARESFRMEAGESMIALLPGSRRSEIQRLLPVFLEVADRITAVLPESRFVIPAATPALQTMIEEGVGGSSRRARVAVIPGQSRRVLAGADAGLIASGTATLEAMLLKCPSVMAYRVNAMTAMLARRSLRIPFFAMPNLMAGEMLMPEFVQDKANAEAITPAVLSLLEARRKRREIAERFAELHARLRLNASEQAAAGVADLLSSRGERD
ncbi:lipid-A-disaccharide synthase [Spiribacter insolitus]|uniref:Lipid-A-disaccharide synthase n=1 Tax=Spiribacter insolitus TaxID=3122417 RepID=A0ABV3T5K6_9GAMM